MQYEVTMRTTMMKTVICENCTEEEARKEPFKYAIGEINGETLDWDVEQVTESK